MSQPKTTVNAGETHPRHLLAIHAWMETYRNTTGFPPSTSEIVKAGFAPSTSVVMYYYGVMSKLGMITVRPRLARGVTIHPRKDWKRHAEKDFAPRLYKGRSRHKKKEIDHARSF